MSEQITAMLQFVDDSNADSCMIHQITLAMHEKLRKKRAEGRGGWFTNDCSNSELLDMLKDHVEKGDMIDVVNLASMIWMREKLYGDKA